MFRAAMQMRNSSWPGKSLILIKGALVPDEVTNGMLKERLAEPDTEKGFIIRWLSTYARSSKSSGRNAKRFE